MMPTTTCLFLLSACLAGAFASERLRRRTSYRLLAASDPTDVQISGPNYVTIGIPYGFSCSAKCNPRCTYTMTLDGKTSYSNPLNTIFTTYVPSKVITCEATNPQTGVTASISKTFQFAEGPSNLAIKAPKMLLPNVESTFECTATCRPSCLYTMTNYGRKLKAINSTVFTYVTPEQNIAEQTVYCTAQNILSQLYVEASASVLVASGPGTVYIYGQTSVTVGDNVQYLCSSASACTPGCTYTWHFRGKVYEGNQVQVPIFKVGKAQAASILVLDIDEYHKAEQLVCTVTNPLSGRTINGTKILQVNDPIAVRPVTLTNSVLGSSYTLICDGASQNSLIRWTKNGKPLSTSDRVHLGDNDATLTFKPLQQSDSGVYACNATDQGKVIPGVPYELNVLYGPLNPQMMLMPAEKLLPYQTAFLLPGHSATFSCSAECNPPCRYAWLFNGNPVSNVTTFSIQSVSEADVGVLACAPYNTKTYNRTYVMITVEMADGPKEVTISGPKSVQVGQASTFECSAVCSPGPCDYSWLAYGRTIHGSKMELTISHYVATETITCIAQNTATKKIVATNTIVDVTDPQWCGC
ncbi:carcinoembryonic antigen-related cell adhesion molecule 5-like [Engraulis encrasicolus]|uniref:carcinoembryonic antigen-related cell adhesion molecule 5-like n=1 Tax=Engraulis encrasicolus TaxID=184585 RepID=UPI002FD1BD03